MTRTATMEITDAFLWNEPNGFAFAERVRELLKHGARAPTDLVAAAVDVAETLRLGRDGHYMTGETEEEWRRLVEEKAAALAQLVLDTLTEPKSLRVLPAPRVRLDGVAVPDGSQFSVQLRQNVVLLWAMPTLDGFRVQLFDDFTQDKPLDAITAGLGRTLHRGMLERSALEAVVEAGGLAAVTFPA